MKTRPEGGTNQGRGNLRVELSFMVHATEDLERVLEIVSKSFGIPTDALSMETMRGHFRNPIAVGSASLLGPDGDKVVASVIKGLSEEEKRSILSDLESFVDEKGALYFRVSKQHLFDGTFILSRSDPIRVKIKPTAWVNRQRCLEIYRSILMGRAGQGTHRR